MSIHLRPLLTALGIAAATSPVLAQNVSNRTIAVDGLNRSFILVLPDDLQPGEQLPVMIWAHGGGGTAELGIELEADYRPFVNSRRFMAVYPQAYPDNFGENVWGYDLGLGETNGNLEIDLAFMRTLIDELVMTHDADSQRIYFGGFSIGGSFAWDVACALSDRVAAVAPVAASMWYSTYDGGCDSAAPTAICHVCGTNDWYAPEDGGWVPSHNQQHIFWVTKNQASVTPETVSLGNGVTRFTWTEGDQCHAVRYFRIQNYGHDVPLFAPLAIWDFVSQYSLEGVIECLDDCPGDVTGDGLRDVNDILRILSAFDIDDGGDTDGDGDTDVMDILLLLKVFGQPC